MKNTTISAVNIVILNREEIIKLPFDSNMKVDRKEFVV